jgi:hypothetical protein
MTATTIEFRIFEKMHLNCAETLRDFFPKKLGKFCEFADLRHYKNGYNDRITVVVKTNMFTSKEEFMEMLLYKLIMAYEHKSADVINLLKLVTSAYK